MLARVGGGVGERRMAVTETGGVEGLLRRGRQHQRRCVGGRLTGLVVMMSALIFACSDSGDGASGGAPPERPHRPGVGQGGDAGGSLEQGESGVESTAAPSSGPAGLSDGGSDSSGLCTAGERRCRDEATEEICDGAGTGWLTAGCADDERCADGFCVTVESCTPGESRCAGAVTREVCREDGLG